MVIDAKAVESDFIKSPEWCNERKLDIGIPGA
jgi:hypothetical protein